MKKQQIILSLALILLIFLGVDLYGKLAPERSENESNIINNQMNPNNESNDSGENNEANDSLNQNNLENNNLNNNTNMIATIKTNKGDIKIEFYADDAPKTVENFITLAEKNYYDGVIFHRVIKGFMIQGGDPTGTGAGGPGYKFADELNPETQSYKNGYKRGVVAMANAGPNTNGSQFFIMHQDYPLPNNYTIFGNVISGIEVVDAIAETETVPGDRPVEEIVMESVTIDSN